MNKELEAEIKDAGGPEAVLAMLKAKKAEQASKVKQINTRDDLRAFAAEYKLRPDWHEPDEQGINTRIRGMHLDNAMGSTMNDLGDANKHGEFNIVLTHTAWNDIEEVDITEDVAVVNLSTLLSWAAEK
jgi:hypothetical protein